MSKGSGRRPASVSDAELAARWEKAFGKSEHPTLEEGEIYVTDCGPIEFPDPVGLAESAKFWRELSEAKVVIKSDTPDS